MIYKLINDKIVEKLKNQDPKELGLFQGKAGICMALYIANKKLKNKEYESIADNVLDNILENLKGMKDLSFQSGLSGIGFMINYLHENNCICGDIDEILSPIDAIIYKEVFREKHDQSIHLDGLMGYLIYITNRLNNPKHNKKSILDELNKSMLRTITNMIFFKIDSLSELNTDVFPSMIWDIPILYYCLGLAHDTNSFSSRIENFVKNNEVTFMSKIPYYNLNRIWVANTLSFLNCRIKDERINSYINLLYSSINYTNIVNEITYSDHFYSGWCYALICLRFAEMNITNHDLKERIMQQKNVVSAYAKDRIQKLLVSDNTKIELVSGLAGLSLSYALFFK